ncbi:phosphotransferase [Alloscardovia criceti]|uniref:phosphotransferase n=1 Tax=Alloscardovia criceti TaxID=356828 RepID=UPI00037E99B4|nr:phosphotransferase [Alloscardovia criceti]
MSGDKKDIVTAVITSVEGVEYDVSVSSSPEGKKILKDRAKAAFVLSHSNTPAGLSFALEKYTLYMPGDDIRGVTADTAVYITPHIDGDAVALRNLTSAQCTAAGTAIATIHRLRPGFLRAAKYPSYTAKDIQNQLHAWIRNLENAGHIPSEIIRNWKNIIGTEGLWNFNTRLVHGGMENGDFLFLADSVNAIRHWENMQINDPARDLAWIFTHLNKSHRDAFIAAYSRVMGSRLDNMIWLRAGLWTQMEQVGEYMRALTNADTTKILAFKSQVNSLAHQIAKNNPQREPIEKKSSLTVGDLLENPEAVQGKAETRSRGGHSSKAAHTRFVVDSGMRSPQVHAEENAPVRAEMSGGTTDDNTIESARNVSETFDGTQAFAGTSTAPAPPQQSARKNWNSTPSQSESFTFTSDSQATPVSHGYTADQTDADAVAESLEDINVASVELTNAALIDQEATIAMQAQSAAAAARHAREGLTYTSQSSYVPVDSFGFVMSSDKTLSQVSGPAQAQSPVDNQEHTDEDSDTGESAIVQDEIETTVFAAHENDAADEQ